MSIAEMKKIINQKVNLLDEDQLKVVLTIIEKVDNKEFGTNSIESIFEEAVAQYGNVLQKLAQ